MSGRYCYLSERNCYLICLKDTVIFLKDTVVCILLFCSLSEWYYLPLINLIFVWKILLFVWKILLFVIKILLFVWYFILFHISSSYLYFSVICLNDTGICLWLYFIICLKDFFICLLLLVYMSDLCLGFTTLSCFLASEMTSGNTKDSTSIWCWSVHFVHFTSLSPFSSLSSASTWANCTGEFS